MNIFKILGLSTLLITAVHAQEQPQPRSSPDQQALSTINNRLSSIQQQLTQMESQLMTIQSKLNDVQKINNWFTQGAPPTSVSSTPSASYSSSVAPPASTTNADNNPWVIHEAP